MTWILFSALGLFTCLHLANFARHLWAESRRTGVSPTWPQLAVGFVTNFFDTLGIGNFAPTTAWYRHAKLVPDELIPGTMNVGHTLPVMLMGFIFIEIVVPGLGVTSTPTSTEWPNGLETTSISAWSNEAPK